MISMHLASLLVFVVVVFVVAVAVPPRLFSQFH